VTAISSGLIIGYGSIGARHAENLLASRRRSS
jgi:hypothetical protein